jgi:hypothetical protein
MPSDHLTADLSSSHCQSVVVDSATMAAEDTPLDPQVVNLAIEETESFLDLLPPELSLRVLPASYYALDIAAAWRGRSGDARAFIRRQVRERLLADLADPADPFALPEVIEEATTIARRKLEKLAARYRADFGSVLVEPEAAPGYAAEALIAWGKAETMRPGSTDNMWAFIRRVVHNLVISDLDAAFRMLQPGVHAQHLVAERAFRELMQADPERDEEEARRIAAELGRRHLARRGGFLVREDDPQAGESTQGGSDPLDEARASAFVARIWELLDGPRYTLLDREAWAYFVTVGFNGRDIPWEALGIDPHTGAQRLFALLRKLREDLGDWFDDDLP